MIQDLLVKMCGQEKDWQKVLNKLVTDMDSKLDRMELDPLKKQVEDQWRKIKKQLKEGPAFNADTAAGFRRQLFERVNCISCDRPLKVTSGVHLITLPTSATGFLSRNRPTSAHELDYLKQQYYSDRFVDLSDYAYLSSSRPCGGSHTVGHPTVKRPSRFQNLATVYPYGDSSPFPYKKEEVDILGVDGVIYKGRVGIKLPLLDSIQEQNNLIAKNSGIKMPRPSSRNDSSHSITASAYHHSRPSTPLATPHCTEDAQQQLPGEAAINITDTEMMQGLTQRQLCHSEEATGV
ncbi:uncharacterized protein C16orf96-like [Latimeria chalumnae]|uniref:uncharacterized protein C16orf96-like n=1 Tax=Latimeria chalumnae TaxID=7897 RepID=UPI0003C178C1|nr:PREDICTED: uncharacterized protein C16orf96-like [Latimeria chalumnae]|eukprot:XP_005990867.1 PREDICTED: uncharacterized protein C16orf96-like [Latimeria chalumnae]